MTARPLAALAAGALVLSLSACSGSGGGDDGMAGMDHSTMSSSPAHDMSPGAGEAGDGHDHMHMGEVIGDATAATQAGFTLEGISTNASTDNPGRLTFRIMKENGAPLINFVTHHERPMHLFLYNQDLSSFMHVHPTMNSGGTWLIELPPMPPGKIHLAANFIGTPDEGEMAQVMLGGDFEVAGAPATKALPKPVKSVMVDGYKVTLDDGLQAGVESKLMLTVTKDGKPATLVPYYGAWTHVAAIDSGSLAAAHLHPAQEWEDGATSPDVLTIVYTPPAAGTQRMFVEFATAEGYHRAEFTRVVG